MFNMRVGQNRLLYITRSVLPRKKISLTEDVAGESSEIGKRCWLGVEGDAGLPCEEETALPPVPLLILCSLNVVDPSSRSNCGRTSCEPEEFDLETLIHRGTCQVHRATRACVTQRGEGKQTR